jgi:glutathione synthase/RimK-type ligase-like ATP-grasp enzyme
MELPMYILTNKLTGPSARLLRNDLEELTKEKIIVTQFPEKVKGKFLRYGNSSIVDKGEDLNLNSVDFIRLCSNKLIFSKEMRKHNIYSPIYNKSTDDLKFPLLIRTVMSSCGARGILKIRNEEDFNLHWKDDFWWTPFIDIKFELRVHLLGGEISRIFKKIPYPNTVEDDMPIRNNYGYHFSLKEENKYGKVLELVNKLKEIFGDRYFCALDVGWDNIRKEYFIFEANSAPGLNENTVKLYADFIGKTLGYEVYNNVCMANENKKGD